MTKLCKGRAERFEQPKAPPLRARRRNIQLPYLNAFQTLWEYRKFFLAGRIDFPSYLGAECPFCGKAQCYRQIKPYWRYAIELFPDFVKGRIPVARFLCRKWERTFSLLPIQLIPYHQYTAGAVVGVLLLALGCWEAGQRGFWGACEAVAPDSLLTPYLVAYWLAVVLRGLRRAHGTLRRWYNLSTIRSPGSSASPWPELKGYLEALGWQPEIRWGPWIWERLWRYSQATGQFLFGTPSQYRSPVPDGQRR